MIGRVLGNIRIESALGAGGMGEVFLGFDEKLQRRVALKAIRGARRLDPGARRRFLREARILSRLDHPGICRIHNLIEYPDCDFLVLEYIEGDTLTRLLREGALSEGRKLAVAEGMARVLAAAHTAGVAHRDLKPDNVMITPDGQVKILDFGLSRLVGDTPASADEPVPDAGGDADPISVRSISGSGSGTSGGSLPSPDLEGGEARLTQQGHVIGTVAYMSPEQARGAPVTEKADLYSLGVILHELFTGKSPYPEGLTTMELLVRVGQGMVGPAEGIDVGLASLIDRLKDVEPERRPSAEEAAGALAGVIARPQRRRRRLRRLALGFAAAALVTLAVWLTWLASRRPDRLEFAPQGRVVVMPFVDRTGGEAWVRTGLRDLVVKPLEGLPAANLAPLDQVEDVLKSRGLDKATELTEGQVMDLRSALGADVVVEAWASRESEALCLTYRVWVSGNRSDRRLHGANLPLLGDRMARMLAEELRLGSLAAGSRDPFASQLYGIGLHTSRTRGAKAARPLFESCLVIDPGFRPARLQLAACAEQLGDWSAAIGEARAVLREAEAAREFSLEAQALGFLGGLYATRTDYAEATACLERALSLEKRRGNLAGQAAAGFQLGRVAYLRGDWARARALLEWVLALERRTRDLPREADTINYLGLVALNTRRFDVARAHFSQAMKLAAEQGDARRGAMSLVNLGNVANHQGQAAEAEKRWNEALAALRGCGDFHNELVVLNNLGVLKLKQKDHAGAAAVYRELVGRSAQTGDRVMEAAASLNLSLCLMAMKKLDEARKCIDRVMALETWVRDDPECFANRAELSFLEGNREEAVRLMEEACRRGGKDWAEGARGDLDRYRGRAPRAKG
ncbi:MAG: protein kinase [Acidobacteria bacterium]|nr:protein kinase [Acidobacteriota bacterium]